METIRCHVISGEGIEPFRMKNRVLVDTGDTCKGIKFKRLGPDGQYHDFSFGEGEKIGEYQYFRDGERYHPEDGRYFHRSIIEKEVNFKNKIKDGETWLFILKSEYNLLSLSIQKALIKSKFDLYGDDLEDCCKTWEKATTEGTDNEGSGPLIWFGDDAVFDHDMLPRMGNIGFDPELPPLKYCPWCGKQRGG